MNSDAPVLLVAVNDRPLPEPVLGNTGDARAKRGERASVPPLAQPKKGVPIEVDIKALAGKPLGVMMVTPQEGPIAVDFPDGRKGRAMVGSITDGKGVGAVTLYFV